MKSTFVRLVRHLYFLLVLLYRLSRGRVSKRALKFLFNFKVLRFIIDFKEIDLFSLKTVIDGGANRGHFSHLLLQINPDVVIFAFEPLATKVFDESVNSCFANLENLKKQYKNFHYSSNALSDTDSMEIFNVTAFDECSSLLKPPNEKNFSASFNIEKSIKVKCIRLQDFVAENNLLEIDLLKLDLQGAELKALTGASQVLRKCCYVFSELNLSRVYEQSTSISEVVDYLKDKGFRFIDIKKVIKASDGSIAQLDGLFQRRNLDTD